MDYPYPIIPFPEKQISGEGSFLITSQLTFSTDQANQENAAWLQKIFRQSLGFEPGQIPRGGALRLSLDPSLGELGEEGYQLRIDSTGITILGLTNAGVFYGIQTLAQILPLGGAGLTEVDLPAVEIEDRPRYPWRGLMLDESRHFHGTQAVKRLLDVLAALKMNIFHWHLTDDQGWRIEIKGHPRLTEIGSVRRGTGQSIFSMFTGRDDRNPHGGFYTQDQIREIVAYAAERQITVVPEIEMPGHSVAALAAYPELSCRGEPLEVRTAIGISKDVYCVGNEDTFTFLFEILNEVIELFPGKYIHIGGDEVPRSRWKRCPKCQQRMIEEGYSEEGDLHRYIINRVTEFLAEHGREAIGWNENLGEGLNPAMIIHYWFRGEQALADAVRRGRRVVLSPFLDYYLDHSYNLTPLSRTYAYQPGIKGLREDQTSSILGVIAPLWTEFVPNQARLDYQVFPRLLAVAETGWTTIERKDLGDFFARYRLFQKRLAEWGIAFARDSQVEPSRWKRIFGKLTIAQKQSKIAE
ncbi:MAG: beta-N-acetylhexosaminidase [Chloroflexota bacterium]